MSVKEDTASLDDGSPLSPDPRAARSASQGTIAKQRLLNVVFNEGSVAATKTVKCALHALCRPRHRLNPRLRYSPTETVGDLLKKAFIWVKTVTSAKQEVSHMRCVGHSRSFSLLVCSR